MENNLSRVIAKAWSDQGFKEKLIKDPHDTLHQEGINLPEGVKVTVCENTDHQLYLVIPQKPSGEFSEEELSALAGGITKFMQDDSGYEYAGSGDFRVRNAVTSYVYDNKP